MDGADIYLRRAIQLELLAEQTPGPAGAMLAGIAAEYRSLMRRAAGSPARAITSGKLP
jgi:hypothetical protein